MHPTGPTTTLCAQHLFSLSTHLIMVSPNHPQLLQLLHCQCHVSL